MKNSEIINKLKKSLPSNKGAIIAPIISGAASLYFFREIVFSNNLTDVRYFFALGGATVLFAGSTITFILLRKMEQDKDKYLLSTVGKIVEDVFKHYGVSMASNAAGPTTAKEMNPILQTIVDLVKGLKELADKNYIKS